MQPLFADVDMDRQRQALLNMLVVLRESLRDLDDIVPDLEELGARHAEYGAQPEHYPVVGKVLIGAMAGIARCVEAGVHGRVARGIRRRPGRDARRRRREG